MDTVGLAKVCCHGCCHVVGACCLNVWPREVPHGRARPLVFRVADHRVRAAQRLLRRVKGIAGGREDHHFGPGGRLANLGNRVAQLLLALGRDSGEAKHFVKLHVGNIRPARAAGKRGRRCGVGHARVLGQLGISSNVQRRLARFEVRTESQVKVAGAQGRGGNEGRPPRGSREAQRREPTVVASRPRRDAPRG